MPADIFWYISRTAALAAYLMFFFNVFLGLGMKTGFLNKVWGKWLSFDLHRFTALLGLSLISLHVFSLLGDTYYIFNLKEVLVPFSSPYRASWTALGVIGFYLCVIITSSFYLRKFTGKRTWHAIHFTSFGLFWIILFHSVRSGTDSPEQWVKVMYFVTAMIISFLVLIRLTGMVFPKETKAAEIKPVSYKDPF